MPKINDVVLEMKNLIKVFPGVKALDDVSLKIYRGEVMALLGENGAGKSTLVKILSGAMERDGGHVFVEGKSLPKKYGPLDARKNGISIIYQELSLLPELTVAENIYLTHEPTKKVLGAIDYNKMYEKSKIQLEKLKANYINVAEKVKNLSLPDRQMVEVAKALATDCKIIIMDEPTTSLTWQETNRLFDVIRVLKEQQVTVIYISHRLDEIFKIADRVAILRDGRLVGSLPTNSTTQEEIISLMTGKKEIELQKRITRDIKESKDRKALLEVKGLTDNKFIKDVSFTVYENEVLGIGGLIGSKRTELVRMIFGADKLGGGQIYISGKRVSIGSPIQAIQNGIGYLSENRKEEALNQGLSIQENIIITDMKSVSKFSFIDWNRVYNTTKNYIQKLRIKGKSTSTVHNLSGGNQQKVAISKWLHAGCRLLIFDEPTRGIDIAAKQEIYKLIRNFAQEGRAAIVVSSEAEELVDICDRILIMSKGRIVYTLNTGDINDGNTLQVLIMGGGSKHN